MKRLLLLAFLLPFLAFSQTCPAPSGNSIIIDSTYTIGSSLLKQTNATLCYNNSTTTKTTAMQFKLIFDTAAFTTPVVTLITSDSLQYLNYYVTNNKIAVTIVYTGADTNFTYPSGRYFNINFTHRPDTLFQYITTFQPLAFDATFKTVASTNKGIDTVLSKYNGGGLFIKAGLKFHGTVANVTGTLTKFVTVALLKKPKVGTTWTTIRTNITGLDGKYNFNETIDTTFWTCKVQIKGDTMALGNVVTVADAQKVNRFVLGLETPMKFDFHSSDVNASGDITVADVYSIFNRIAGRFTSFTVPDVRFFTKTQYDSISYDSLTNYSLIFPGTSVFEYTITPTVDSVNIYVLASGDANATGFHMARLTPIKIVNPLNAPNFIIDQTTDYYANLNSVEINMPTLNVEEGNLVNIPVKVLTGVFSLGSVQLALKYDMNLLEFKGIVANEKTGKWLSFMNPNDGIVEWGGLDLTNNQYAMNDGEQIITLQFIAKKPKTDWGVSPIYVTRKFVGNDWAADMSVTPTNGMVAVQMVKYPTINIGNPLGKDQAEILIYPNPTTGLIAVEFNVPANSTTTVYFIDILGNKVANVIDTKMPAGQYRYSANLTGLKGSTYFAIMECDGKILASKQILNNISL